MGSCCSGPSKDSDNPYGKSKTHDPSFDGPIHKRSCTDIICCLIFFTFILCFIVVGIFAWLNGDPIILLYPTDNQGRICGVEYGDLDLSNKTNVFFFDLTKCASPESLLKFQCATTQICINSCPNDTWTYYTDYLSFVAARATLLVSTSPITNLTNLQLSQQAVSSGLDWSKYICTYGYNIQTEFEQMTNGEDDLRTIMESGKCAPYYIPMVPLVGRCIPQVAKDAGTFIAKTVSGQDTTVVDALNNTVTSDALNNGSLIVQTYLNAQDVGMKIFADFTVAWYWVLAGLGVAALVSFLWIVLMRWIAGPMVWITIIALLGVIGFGIYYTYTEWQRLLTTPGADTSLISVGFTTDLSQYLALTDTWLAFFIILCIVGGIMFLLVIFLRKRILIAIQIITAASKAVGMMISTLFYPLVTFILCTIVVTFWAATALFLASSGDPVYRVIDSNAARAALAGALNNTACNITEWTNPNHTYSNDSSLTCAFIEYGGESLFQQNVFWLQIACAFGLLWLLNWVIALGECTLAGAFASYYWAFKKPKDIPALPLLAAFGRTLRYHTGSLAFGAFIIALIQIIRLMLEYLDHKVKGSENKVAKFVIKCCKCCFWCLEKFMKFLNRNAYIMVAVYGKNFCWSAKEAFMLLMRNIVRVAVVDKVTDFLLFMGKLIVTAGLVGLSWAFFGNQITFVADYVPSLNYYWLPIIVIGLGAYIVAAGFFNTYGMAVDTIFLCFLEDMERNDGSPERPYHASKQLLNLLKKKNSPPTNDPIYEEVS